MHVARQPFSFLGDAESAAAWRGGVSAFRRDRAVGVAFAIAREHYGKIIRAQPAVGWSSRNGVLVELEKEHTAPGSRNLYLLVDVVDAFTRQPVVRVHEGAKQPGPVEFHVTRCGRCTRHEVCRTANHVAGASVNNEGNVVTLCVFFPLTSMDLRIDEATTSTHGDHEARKHHGHESHPFRLRARIFTSRPAPQDPTDGNTNAFTESLVTHNEYKTATGQVLRSALPPFGLASGSASPSQAIQDAQLIHGLERLFADVGHRIDGLAQYWHPHDHDECDEHLDGAVFRALQSAAAVFGIDRVGGAKEHTEGYTMLHYVVGLGLDKSCRFLLENHAPVDAITNEGVSVLHFAIAKGRINLAMMITATNVSLDPIDRTGYTPSDSAAADALDTVVCQLDQVRRHRESMSMLDVESMETTEQGQRNISSPLRSFARGSMSPSRPNPLASPAVSHVPAPVLPAQWFKQQTPTHPNEHQQMYIESALESLGMKRISKDAAGWSTSLLGGPHGHGREEAHDGDHEGSNSDDEEPKKKKSHLYNPKNKQKKPSIDLAAGLHEFFSSHPHSAEGVLGQAQGQRPMMTHDALQVRPRITPSKNEHLAIAMPSTPTGRLDLPHMMTGASVTVTPTAVGASAASTALGQSPVIFNGTPLSAMGTPMSGGISMTPYKGVGDLTPAEDAATTAAQAMTAAQAVQHCMANRSRLGAILEDCVTNDDMRNYLSDKGLAKYGSKAGLLQRILNHWGVESSASVGLRPVSPTSTRRGRRENPTNDIAERILNLAPGGKRPKDKVRALALLLDPGSRLLDSSGNGGARVTDDAFYAALQNLVPELSRADIDHQVRHAMMSKPNAEDPPTVTTFLEAFVRKEVKRQAEKTRNARLATQRKTDGDDDIDSIPLEAPQSVTVISPGVGGVITGANSNPVVAIMSSPIGLGSPMLAGMSPVMKVVTASVRGKQGTSRPSVPGPMPVTAVPAVNTGELFGGPEVMSMISSMSSGHHAPVEGDEKKKSPRKKSTKDGEEGKKRGRKRGPEDVDASAGDPSGMLNTSGDGAERPSKKARKSGGAAASSTSPAPGNGAAVSAGDGRPAAMSWHQPSTAHGGMSHMDTSGTYAHHDGASYTELNALLEAQNIVGGTRRSESQEDEPMLMTE